MDYALVPDHLYPTPVHQMDQFLSFLITHAKSPFRDVSPRHIFY